MLQPGAEEKGDLLSIRHVATDNQRDLLLAQLLNGDLKRIRLALEINQHWRVHATKRNSLSAQVHPYSLPSATDLETHLICRARVPRIRAFSYLVM